MRKKIIISAFTLLSFFVSYAQFRNLKIGYQEFPTNLTGHASDGLGNMYYSGYFKGELKINNQVAATGAGLEDIFLVKQNLTGTTIFSKSFGSKSSDVPVVDGLSYANNNLYLACQITDEVSFQSILIGPYVGTEGSVNTGCIVNFDTVGNVKWVTRTSIKITEIYAIDNTIHVLGVSYGDVKYNDTMLYQNLPGHSIIHLMLDTLGNLLNYKSVVSHISTIYDLQSSLFISSYSDGKLSMLLNIYGDSSFQFGKKTIPLPGGAADYSVLIKTDTSYSSVSYKILNPVPLSFVAANGIYNRPPIQLSKQDSIYIILNAITDSINFNYDGLNVPVDYNHNTLVVLDSSLKAGRVIGLGNINGTESNTGFNRIYLKTIDIIKNEIFISGTFTGLNESPSNETIPNEQDITLIPNLHTEIDLNGPSESFIAKTSLGFTSGSIYWFGNHSEYEISSLFYNFSHTANDSLLVYSFINDNVWNPRIVNTNSGTVSGAMIRNADLPDDIKFVEYFSDGSRLVIGSARGRTSLDTSVIGIKCNQNREDAFIARITSKGEIQWYKRLQSTLLVASEMKLLMKGDTGYFLINFGSSVNENNYIEINKKSYAVNPNQSLLASIDTAGNINVISLENNVIKSASIMDFNLFKNGDIGILTRVDYFNFSAGPFPNPGFFLLRLNPGTNELILTRKIITLDAYSLFPTKLEIDSHDNLYISSPLDFTVSPQNRYFTLGLHDGNRLIDTITIENNVTTQGGLGILKIDMNKFHWYKRAISPNRFNVDLFMPPTFASNDKIVFMGRPFPENSADTSSSSFYWDNKLIMTDMNPSKTYFFRMDTSGRIEMQKSIGDFYLQYAKKTEDGSLLISGNISKATSIDTISIGFQGSYDALSFVIDSTFKTTQSYRLASPYVEYMSDIAIWKDSLFSLAFTAQTVPSFYSNRPQVLFNDYNPDAYLSSNVIQKVMVLPLQLISFKGTEKEDVVYLDWSVVSNEGFNKYVVQRSFNGQGFKDIGMRNSISNAYKYICHLTDNLKDYGRYYYRLQIISSDEKISYSEIINILFMPKGNSFYFDNGSQQLHILREDTHAYAWRIFDASGKSVFSGEKSVGNKLIDLSKQPKGEYIIQSYDNTINQAYKFIN